jgi:hypothetical protein
MVSRGSLYPESRCEGRFFGRRVNCEQIPLLPARVVAWMLDDTRKIPYLLIWKSRSDGTVKEAARIAPYYEAAGRGGPDWTGAFEIKRHDGTRDFIRTLLRTLPRNRGRVRLLICAHCSIPRRGLYGWEPGGRFTNSVVRSTWGCRKCNLLRYASEGGALLIRPRGTLGLVFGTGHSPRPESWLPDVFTSTEQAAEAGVL